MFVFLLPAADRTGEQQLTDSWVCYCQLVKGYTAFSLRVKKSKKQLIQPSAILRSEHKALTVTEYSHTTTTTTATTTATTTTITTISSTLPPHYLHHDHNPHHHHYPYQLSQQNTKTKFNFVYFHTVQPSPITS
jgi:uncharacterized protein YchJ